MVTANFLINDSKTYIKASVNLLPLNLEPHLVEKDLEELIHKNFEQGIKFETF